jgi:predicted acyltransferase
MIAVRETIGSFGYTGAHDEVADRETAARAAVVARAGSLDVARGLAVVAMLAANLVNVFLRDIPSVLAHNQGDTLRMFDLPAPVFQFMVGVSLPLFLASRLARGRTAAEARRDALGRFARLIVLGMVLDGVGKLSLYPQWGVLQTLGLGGMIATLCEAAPDEVVLVVTLGILALASGSGSGEVHASPIAALKFLPLTLGGLLAGRGIVQGKTPQALATRAALLSATFLALGFVLYDAGIPFNKIIGTSSFVALSTGVAAALLAGTALFEAMGGRVHPWLRVVGRNALTAWVTLYVLVYYPAWLVVPGWERLSIAPGVMMAALVTTAICASTAALGRRGIRMSI